MFTHVLRRYRKYTSGRPKKRFMNVVKDVNIVRVRRMQRKGLDEDRGEQPKKAAVPQLQFQFRYVSFFPVHLSLV